MDGARVLGHGDRYGSLPVLGAAAHFPFSPKVTSTVSPGFTFTNAERLS